MFLIQGNKNPGLGVSCRLSQVTIVNDPGHSAMSPKQGEVERNGLAQAKGQD